jgi:hypothetical protein
LGLEYLEALAECTDEKGSLWDDVALPVDQGFDAELIPGLELGTLAAEGARKRPAGGRE